MLQPAGDLGLQQEPRAAVGVVGVPVLDLLERHLAVQLLVVGDEDLAQAAAGVRAEDAEPLARGGGHAIEARRDFRRAGESAGQVSREPNRPGLARLACMRGLR